MHTRLASVLLAALFSSFLAASGFAGKDVVCFSETIPTTPTDWNRVVGLRQFDPQMGVLLGVTIELSGAMQGSYGVESLDSEPALATAHFAFDFTLLDYSSTPVTFMTAATTITDALAPFDGRLNFAGTSGVFHSGLAFADSRSYSPALTPASLTAFVGTGEIGFTVSARRASVITGPGNLYSQFETTAGAVLQVCYTYAPDCNSNGIPDDVELAGGAFDLYGPGTCEPDGILDACQPEPDCNGDGIPNRCQITGTDCDGNGVPNECEILKGAVDLSGPTSCHPDGVPDECQTIADCDQDGIPDHCEPDSDGDGIPDDCDA